MAAEGSPICEDMDFDWAIDTVAEPDVVSVDITCIADLSELTLIAVPGDGDFTASADEVLDVYREDP